MIDLRLSALVCSFNCNLSKHLETLAASFVLNVSAKLHLPALAAWHFLAQVFALSHHCL